MTSHVEVAPLELAWDRIQDRCRRPPAAWSSGTGPPWGARAGGPAGRVDAATGVLAAGSRRDAQLRRCGSGVRRRLVDWRSSCWLPPRPGGWGGVGLWAGRGPRLRGRCRRFLLVGPALLLRTGAVLATSLPLLLAAGLLVPSMSWAAVTSLLPALALTAVVLAASTWVPPTAVAVALAVSGPRGRVAAFERDLARSWHRRIC